jgi:putative flavoprotein involved in K+ transport
MAEIQSTRVDGREQGVSGLVEAGEAFRRVSEARRAGAGPERLDVIVIGAGQAGLSVGYYLAQRGVRFAVLDASERVGDAWRRRWDSLRLFTPARYDALPGLPFPGAPERFPTKDEMADYLEAYAEHFALPVRTGTRVERVSRRGERYVVHTAGGELEAEHVVVAMASYQRPRLPAFAAELGPGIRQLHSSAYRTPSQLEAGGVLVAGAGNSGAEIALELSRTGRKTWICGRDTGQVPFRLAGFWGRLFLTRLVLRFVFHRILTIKTALGRRARQKTLSGGAPLIRTRAADLSAAGVERGPKVVGVKNGRPELADGRVLDVRSVVWCTGFHPGFSWIDRPVFDAQGEPVHDGGVARGEPGLYFVGLHFLYAFSSTMIHGVSRDAARIVGVIAERGSRHETARAGTAEAAS